MSEKSSFKEGSANGREQNKPTSADSAPKDEYYGRYKDAAVSASEEEKFGGSQNPVKNVPMPARNLKGVGG